MPSEPKNYRLDGEPRAVYWEEYRRAFEQVSALLTPGGVILPEHVDEYLLDMHIGFLHNSLLQPHHFDLREIDRQPLESDLTNIGLTPYRIPYPGKSAHFDFLRSHERKVTKDDLSMTVDAIFGRKWRNGDHLHIVSVEKLQEIGFQAYWAPLPNNPLHVRLVSLRHIENPTLRDYSKREKELLRAVWFKVK